MVCVQRTTVGRSMIEIVCYMGGTCGDLISAMIDYRGSRFEGRKITHTHIRQRLKKPQLFISDLEKDEYLKQVESETDYRSISSHDMAYHISRKHSFIGITCDDFKIALKAAHRFKEFHRPLVWEQVQAASGAKTIEDYAQMIIDFSSLVRQHTTRTIKLESIMNKKVYSELNELLPIDKNGRNVYLNWIHWQSSV